MTEAGPGRRMKIGVIPSMAEGSLNGRTPRFEDFKAMALTAEAIGLDSFWLADHLIYRFPERDENGCWEAMTFPQWHRHAHVAYHRRSAGGLHLVPQSGAAGQDGGRP